MTDRLKGKVALVTGAASGIGLAIANRFIEEGAFVYLSDRDETTVAEACANLSAASPLTIDVSRESDWERALHAIAKDGRQLDILVNNAGIPSQSPLEETTLEEWRQVMAVNLDGTFLGCKHTVKAMKGRGGSIVNVSSAAAFKASQVGPAYGASKAGVLNFTKTVAMYCASSGYNIRCNSLHPGLTRTPMMGAVPEETLQRVAAGIPMGELGLPVDIANGAVYLASDEARYTTGSALVVDGGYTI